MTAAQVLGKPPETLTRDERNKAKAVNFGIIYGISSFGLSEQLGISREEAQSFIDTYLARFPRVNEFIAATIEHAKSDGYVTTLFGRRRPIPELRASNYQTRSLGERLAVNTVMQGSAADIIKVAMIGIAPAPARRGPPLAARAADPRRAPVRGRRRRGGRAADARRGGDDGRLSARPAARGRRRCRRDLAGGEMTWTQISGTLSALPARRGEEPGTYLWIDAGELGEHLVAELFLPAVASDSLDGALGVAIGSIRVDGDDRSGEVRLEFGRVRDGRGVVSARGCRCRLRHRLRAQPPSARGRLLPPLRRPSSPSTWSR